MQPLTRKNMSITLTGTETKADLLKICEENGIEVTDKKPTNTKLLELINASGIDVDNPNAGIPKLSEVPDDEIPGEVLDENGEVLVKMTSKQQDIAEDNERSILISVTDHDNTHTVEDDEENRLFSASWGNLLCPPRRESVLVNGSPQYASRGMVKHMRTLTVPTFTKGVNGAVIVGKKARFTINELEGWTEEQFEALKRTQAGRIA